MKKRKKMSKVYLYLCLIGLAVIFAGCGDSSGETAETGSAASGSSTLEDAKESGVLSVASSNDAPFAYIDVNTNEFSGIDADIIKEIASRIGIESVEMVEVPFENLIVELNKEGSVDMVTDAMYIREERLQQAYFTDIWYQEGEAIVIPTDSDIASFDDLTDKVIGAQKGTAFFDVAEQWKEAGEVEDVSVFSRQTELMLAVDTGKVDAIVTDGIVANYTLAQDSSLDLKVLDPYEPEATGQIGAAINFEDKDLLDEVNAALNEMKEDGTLMEILESYGLDESYYVGVEEGKTENVQ